MCHDASPPLMMNGTTEALNVPSPCCSPGVTPSELTACSRVIAGGLGESFIFPLASFSLLCHLTVSPLRRPSYSNKWMPVIGCTVDLLVSQQATLQTGGYVIIYYYRRYVVLLSIDGAAFNFITTTYAHTYVIICVTASSSLC